MSFIGFNNFGKERKQNFSCNDDKKLILIDPSENGFFDNVLGFVPDDDLDSLTITENNNKIELFIEAVKEVKETSIGAFLKPIYDPALTYDGTVIFEAGNAPAVEHSFNFWKQKTKEMPSVNGMKWCIGSEYQYYAFLVWLINQLIKKPNWDLNKALKQIVLDSSQMGNYMNLTIATNGLEQTGSRPICNVYDLANTYKMLKCSHDEFCAYWLASGHWDSHSDSLASLEPYKTVNASHYFTVAWLVLS